MLARVAENIYWMSRYLERAEGLARLIDVNTNLQMDLPKGIVPSWDSLVTIIGSDEAFTARFGEVDDEAKVLRFLITDKENGQSIFSNVSIARENARTVRDLLPRQAWEEINVLHQHVMDNGQSGVSKRGRFAFLSAVIRASQVLSGILSSTMNHDEAYQFVRLGRMLERADMTTRIVDVRTAHAVEDAAGDLQPIRSVQWMSVLRSLSGLHAYRLTAQGSVTRDGVIAFLLQSPNFPRSVRFCVNQMALSLDIIGSGEAPRRDVGRIVRLLDTLEPDDFSVDVLPQRVDDMQLYLAETHESAGSCYFHPEQAPPENLTSQSQNQSTT